MKDDDFDIKFKEEFIISNDKRFIGGKSFYDIVGEEEFDEEFLSNDSKYKEIPFNPESLNGEELQVKFDDSRKRMLAYLNNDIKDITDNICDIESQIDNLQLKLKCLKQKLWICKNFYKL